MTTENLYQDFNWKGKIRRIYHISDIHIHLNSRHDEYQHVFEKLYTIIKADTKDAITLITGDILHSKTELLPECIEFTRKFFMDLAKIIPLVFIAGNHDMNVSNEHRMDALTPIRNGIGSDYPIYYLEKTGIYRFGHLLFSLASVRDYIIIDPASITQRVEGDILISLFHGRVNGTVLNNGIKVDGEINRRTNKIITPTSFAGYDYVMMGDIHMQQFFGEARRMAYAGSLIQQNHGESLEGHGVLVWNMEGEGTCEFINIASDYGYITVTLKNGVAENENFGALKHIHLRLLLENTGNQQVQEYIARLKQRIDIIDITYQEVEVKVGDSSVNDKKNDDSVKINNHEYQNQLIEEYLLSVDCEQTMITQIKELNRIANESLNIRGENTCVAGTVWRLIKLEFSNLFSFGEGNVIDFTAYNGILGIIAPNHYGKSSILDIILFMLYDKFPRKGNVKDIVNNRKNAFHAKITFSIQDVQYIIEKQGVISGTGRATVKAKFYRYDQVRNIKEILDEESVIKTKNAVLKYVGDYDDMIQTNISLQHQNCIFIDAENTARKKELERILQIDFIDGLTKNANVAVADRKAVMKHILAKSPNEVQLVIEKNIGVGEGKLSNIQKRLKVVNNELAGSRDEAQRLRGLIIPGVEEKYRALVGLNDGGDDEDDGDFVNYSITLDSNYKKSCEEMDMKRRGLVRKISSSFIDYDSFMKEYEGNKEIIRADIDTLRSGIKEQNEALEKAYGDRKPVKGGQGVSILVLDEKRAALVKISGFIDSIRLKITEVKERIKLEAEKIGGANDTGKLELLPSSFITYLNKYIEGLGAAAGSESVEALWEQLEDCMKPKKRKEPIIGIVKELLEMSGATAIQKFINTYQQEVVASSSKENEGLGDGSGSGYSDVVGVEELEEELKHLEDQKVGLEKWISDAVEYLEVVKVNSEVELKIKAIKRERETLEEKVNGGLAKIRVMDADFMTIGAIRKLDAERGEVERKYNAEIERLKKNKDVLAELESMCGKNVVTRKLIDVENDKVARLEGELNTLTKEEKTVEVALGGHRVKLDEVKAEIAEVVRIEKEMEIWGYYLDSLKAMPYTLIAKVVPLMEKKINGFLSNVANFVIKVVVESGRIDLYIDRPVYNGKLVLLNNASGFERFISSLAIRLALMEISQLPKPNFIAIDEGWTSFDFNNLHNVGTIFDYLKARFEMVINISHLQNIREHCGHQLNLVKDKDGFSCVA